MDKYSIYIKDILYIVVESTGGIKRRQLLGNHHSFHIKHRQLLGNHHSFLIHKYKKWQI